MEVEHGSLTPLVFTTAGVMGYEFSRYHKALAEKLSEKKGESYQDIMRYLRVKFSFLAMKSTLLCLRGSRSTFKNIEHSDDFDFAYNLDELGMWDWDDDLNGFVYYVLLVLLYCSVHFL